MITFESVDFGYRKQPTLFKELSTRYKSGCIYGILGENGAGKSTLLKMMAGALFPQRGTIIVNGNNPKERLPSFMSSLFFIPENLRLPNQNMKQFTALNAPFYPLFSEALLKKTAQEFDLDLSKRFSEMSHGEQKKAYISFGLSCQPSVLLMDEPTNGLDIISKSLFRRIIAQSVTHERIILISTHQVTDLEQLTDQVSILHRGKMLLNESIEQITRCLHFGAITPNQTAIYSESSIRGEIGVTKNSGNEESRIDLELLFKATLHNNKELLSALSNR